MKEQKRYKDADWILTNLKETSKEFGLGKKKFLKWLIRNVFIHKEGSGVLGIYTDAVKAGLFNLHFDKNKRYAFISTQGKEYFRLLLFKQRKLKKKYFRRWYF